MTVKDINARKKWMQMFASRLNNKMLEKHTTLDKLATKTGMDEIVLNGYTTGTFCPSGYEINMIAKALECSSSKLIDFTDEEIEFAGYRDKNKSAYHFKNGLLWAGMILVHNKSSVVDDNGTVLYFIDTFDIPYLIFGFSKKRLMKRLKKAFDITN